MGRELPEVEIYFGAAGQIVPHARTSQLDPAAHLQLSGSIWGKLQALFHRLTVTRAIVKLHPDVIQASHVKELPWAIWYGLLGRSSIVYDAHEDYFNQVYEHSGKTLTSLIKGLILWLTEFALARVFAAVFCTDEFLAEKFSHWAWGCRNVNLVRNFPPASITVPISSYEVRDNLRLVYVGTADRYKGLLEAASYVSQFNADLDEKKLTLSIYGPMSSVVEDAIGHDCVHYLGWLEYKKLMNSLNEYDVGTCLWLETKKLKRNLPIKNFDYMAAGLPIITSNFGNVKAYAEMAGAAICIDPTSYEEFRAAIDKLWSADFRKRLGQSGREFVETSGCFEVEGRKYVAVIQALMG